ncbi:MAG: dUTP diphosphatase [Oscillospiraceae bacterium]|nr:dUTP diphosphatase [Oscillospiraceae bacterium]
MEVPMNNTLKFKLDPGAYVPIRAHEDDAGLDLISPVDVNIWTKGREAICTGVHVQIPKGYVGMITAKSGLMRDHGIITTGTIDAGYTGPINVVLFNSGDHIFCVKRGMKIAQLVIKQIITPQIEVVDELEETERGAGGFGSTGSMAKEATDHAEM